MAVSSRGRLTLPLWELVRQSLRDGARDVTPAGGFSTQPTYTTQPWEADRPRILAPRRFLNEYVPAPSCVQWGTAQKCSRASIRSST